MSADTALVSCGKLTPESCCAELALLSCWLPATAQSEPATLLLAGLLDLLPTSDRWGENLRCSGPDWVWAGVATTLAVAMTGEAAGWRLLTRLTAPPSPSGLDTPTAVEG